MSDQAAIAVSAQQTTLRTIAIAAGFQTGLGARVLTAANLTNLMLNWYEHTAKN